MSHCLNNIGVIYRIKGDLDLAINFLERSILIQKEIKVKNLELITRTYLFLCYKKLNIEYNVKVIKVLINKAENIGFDFEFNLRLYELLEDKSYLETSYSQLQKIASDMDEELANKFLHYSIPKYIVDEWNKIND